jgi:hypothetical protein
MATEFELFRIVGDTKGLLQKNPAITKKEIVEEIQDIHCNRPDMKYKVGDTVLIHSKKWWDLQEKDYKGNVCYCGMVFTKAMAKYCGQVREIEAIEEGWYRLKGIPVSSTNANLAYWADWKFEEGL